MKDNFESNNDTNLVYFSRLHWIIFSAPVIGLLISLAIGLYFTVIQPIALIFCLFFLIWIAITWVTYYFSSLTIQQNQIILRTGIIVRQTIDIPVSKIESIDIRQTILGSILHYGTLIITGTGGTRQYVNNLQRPLTCRRYIEELLNRNAKRE